MKLLLPLLILNIFLFTNCTEKEFQQSLTEESAREEKVCNNLTQARVDFMVVTESGVENFFYLTLLDKRGNDVKTVFPQNLFSKFQQEGMLIDVSYNETNGKHKYIICLAGHQIMDTDNPDYDEMPIIDVCSAEKTKN